MRITENSTGEICSKFIIQQDNRVLLFNEAGEVLTTIEPEIILDNEHDPKNFKMVVLHNSRDDCSENSIFQVKVGDIRIGWIFPIQALHSAEHDYAEDQFFLKYAYVAWYILLNECEMTIESFETFNLFENFSDDTSLLIIDKDNCKEIDDFNIKNYEVSLFKNGYSRSGRGNIFTQIHRTSKYMQLQRQAIELDDISYIRELFVNQIPNENNAISRFHIYYQIIEILIARVFSDLFEEFLEDLKVEHDDLFEKKEELSKHSNEKGRINILFNQYCQVESALGNMLNDACLRLLNYTNSKISNSVNDNLYQVRCLIVHRMYLLNNEAIKILAEIDDLFLEVIMQLVLSYSKERRKFSTQIQN